MNEPMIGKVVHVRGDRKYVIAQRSMQPLVPPNADPRDWCAGQGLKLNVALPEAIAISRAYTRRVRIAYAGASHMTYDMQALALVAGHASVVERIDEFTPDDLRNEAGTWNTVPNVLTLTVPDFVGNLFELYAKCGEKVWRRLRDIARFRVWPGEVGYVCMPSLLFMAGLDRFLLEAGNIEIPHLANGDIVAYELDTASTKDKLIAVHHLPMPPARGKKKTA